ncbi:hypothetical protein ER308_08750 [Egibacter rhizosphaerae]|uniref:DISARM protein DrmE C-terminal domain-containing protein n=1 Tax=Egibacter rhizosphaerae TaxID=1670831 RepID=A0A411YEK9_9ACTN|nr:hypothetical protein ER308_08750 [Egibacter rhizosphaerae]
MVSDLGDRETARVVDERCAVVSHWPVIDELVAALWRSGGRERTRSPLTTSALLDRDPGEVAYSDVHAPAFDRSMRQAITLLTDAHRVAEELPYPLQAARRTLNTLVQLASTAEAFNRSAALDHRARTLNSLRADVARTRSSDLGGMWHRYAATRWEGLRALILDLVDGLTADNPKFLALLSALEVSARRYPEHRLVVRVASEAAAAAVVDDLLEYGEHELALGDQRLQIVPWTARLPWSERDTTEILPALPPRSRREALWSGEANRRIVLAYPWEVEALPGLLDAEADRASAALRRSFPLQGLDADAAPRAAAATPRRFDGIPPGPEPAVTPVDLDVDLAGLTADLAALERVADDPGDRDAPRPGGGASHAPVPGYAVELEPSGQVWLVPQDSAIERVAAMSYRRWHVEDLAPGDQVIVARGTGREDLFTRLVEEKHRDHDVQDLKVVIERWRRACRAVVADCDQHQPTIEARLRHAGCQVRTQLDAWAHGRTIAPQHPEDIACIARLAGDEWLQRHWRRVAEVARELRGLHQRIGRVISGAMREAADGAGPNLRALAAELGGDPSDVLDEFEVATVRRIEPREEIPAHALGGVHPPGT